uniref:Uncharacterized protein n=1 Tax=Aegilops tauschii subsp. strangulata TaxID=200361 RepID=A0A453DDW1_AEGTS
RQSSASSGSPPGARDRAIRGESSQNQNQNQVRALLIFSPPSARRNLIPVSPSSFSPRTGRHSCPPACAFFRIYGGPTEISDSLSPAVKPRDILGLGISRWSVFLLTAVDQRFRGQG